jgi:phage terminase small subunit
VLTHREARYVKGRIEGLSEGEALRSAGFSNSIAHSPAQLGGIERMRAEVARLQAELVQQTITETLIDATEIHEYLTEALRARISDIRRDDGSFIPTSQWPDIWQRMYEAGDCEIEQLNERSGDGEDKDKQGGWDSIGTVTKVKIKFASRVKLLELAMKHKGVNALIQPNEAPVVIQDNRIQIQWANDSDSR